MGNTQSTQSTCSQRRSRPFNRLSKPPTNQSTNLLSPARDIDSITETPPLNLYGTCSPCSPWQDSRVARSPQLESPINVFLSAEPPSPLSLHPSHCSSQTVGEDGGTRSNFGGMMDELKRRLSRSGSQTRGSRFSQTPEMDQVDARDSQNIPGPARKIGNKKQERTFGLGVSSPDGIPSAENYRFSSIRRLSLNNSEKPLKSPKSLLQTIFSPRNTEQEGPAFSYWGPDGYGPFRRTSTDLFSYDMTDSSALRASTPSDLEYSHLGRLKLGSLRVVNGSASPAPSDRVPASIRRQSFPDLKSVHMDQHNSSGLLRSRSREWLDTYSSNNSRRACTHRSHFYPSTNGSATPRIDRTESPQRPEHGKCSGMTSNESIPSLPAFRLSWPMDPEAFFRAAPVSDSTKDHTVKSGALESVASRESCQAFQTTSKTDNVYSGVFEDEGMELIVAQKNQTIEHEDGHELSQGRSMGSSMRNSTSTLSGRKLYSLTKADSGYSSASSNRSSLRNKHPLAKMGDRSHALCKNSNVMSSGATKAIEECNETSVSRPISRRSSSPEAPPPVPRKDTPIIFKSPSSGRYPLSVSEEFITPRLPNVQANGRRMGHVRSHSYDIPKPTKLYDTQILSPLSVDGGLYSFLADSSPEQQQRSWLCSPGSPYNPLKGFEANRITLINKHDNNDVTESTIPNLYSASNRIQLPADSAHFFHPHPLQAHSLHRPQSMVNLNRSACLPEQCPDPQRQEQQEEQHRYRSLFRHRSRSKKRSTGDGDRTGFFVHRIASSKPKNAMSDAAPEPAPASKKAATLPVSSAIQTSPCPKLTGWPLSSPGTAIMDKPPATYPGSRLNNFSNNSARKHSRVPFIARQLPASSTSRNSSMSVRPKRSFVRLLEGRGEPLFCIGIPQPQSKDE
ncbi:hypothetical protein AJ79_09506 [Helicocarpus griseus UAMH5409]|uniref:Uncharacterized protein n=1 Tax=Helicocarpus griseus UAMH5409 TaxID=1447875 RepID=A0A2B7WAR0_9EURO|nr:hypothetical protein AJ79_09506 [Helicocarpus griseus UAMH5409]